MGGENGGTTPGEGPTGGRAYSYALVVALSPVNPALTARTLVQLVPVSRWCHLGLGLPGRAGSPEGWRGRVACRVELLSVGSDHAGRWSSRHSAACARRGLLYVPKLAAPAIQT